MFLLRASLLDEDVPLLISMGVVMQLGSVIDVAEKTIEFQTFQNVRVLVEVVAGHLTVELQPKHALALQKTVNATDMGTGTLGTGGYHSSTMFRQGRFGLVIHHTSCSHDCKHRKKTLTITKLTQRMVKQTFRVVIFKPQVRPTI